MVRPGDGELRRKITNIGHINYNFRPMFGEFDTVGIVVKTVIEDHEQTLWLSDNKAR